jgi:hypothetical protein
MSSVYLLRGSRMVPVEGPDRLTREQERAIREDLAEATPPAGSPVRNWPGGARVPVDLLAAHRRNSMAVLDFLVRLVVGSDPTESVTAAAVALALLGPEGGGRIYVERFDPASYDAVDPEWGTTPRDHWLATIRTRLRPAKWLGETLCE